MTLGERLLRLTAEYQQHMDAEWDADGKPVGVRPVTEIAADYEAALRELLT